MANYAKINTVKEITRMKINLNDDNMNVGFTEEDNFNGFKIEKKEIRQLSSSTDKNVINGITYEMSATRLEYTRTVYSILDLLSDVGGLFGALMPIC